MRQRPLNSKNFNEAMRPDKLIVAEQFGWICIGISGVFDRNTDAMICCLLRLVFR
jgi:hypothetical protein